MQKPSRRTKPSPDNIVDIDADLVDWFKRKGPRYQSRINAVLRAYVEAHK